jgi:hypothetical protein
MIAEMLIGVKKNLSKLSAGFVVCLAFRLRCDISFEASFGFLSDLVLRPPRGANCSSRGTHGCDAGCVIVAGPFLSPLRRTRWARIRRHRLLA